MWYPFFDILVKANVVNTQTFRVRASNNGWSMDNAWSDWALTRQILKTHSKKF